MEKLKIICSTDLHGFLLENSFFVNGNSSFGLLHFINYIKKSQKKMQTLFVDNGDFFSGSYDSFYYQKNVKLSSPVVEIFNELNCLFTVIGNHELDNGLKYLKKLQNQSNFQWMSANILAKNEEAPNFKKYYFHTTKAGKKIAFIGLSTLECEKLILKKSLHHFVIIDPIKALNNIIDKVREAKPDLIFVSYHGGYEQGLRFNYTELKKLKSLIADKFPDIDILTTGHTHCYLSGHKINSVHTLQAGFYGKTIGEININFTKNKPKINSKLIKPEKNFYLPTSIKKKVKKASEWLNEKISSCSEDFFKNQEKLPFINPSYNMELIHKIVKHYAKADTVSTHFWQKLGFSNKTIRRHDIIDMLPKNSLVVLQADGAIVRKALEKTFSLFQAKSANNVFFTSKFYSYDVWSDIKFNVDLSKKKGQRVSKISFKGQELKSDTPIKVVLYHFRSNGAFGYDFYSHCPKIWESQKSIIELAIEYLSTQKFPKIELQKNWLVHFNNQKIENLTIN